MASNNLKALSWVLLASALTLLAQLQDAAAQSPTPSTNLAVSANTTGSLGNLCSSQTGVLSLIQAAAANQDSAGLGVVVPANLTNVAALQEIAQIAWEYIYTYPFPIVAKTLAVGTANGTAVNTFYLRSDHLATSNDTSVVAPNHDTIYSQAWLDLSQGPQIITVPTFESGRYWIVPFLDAYTNFWSAIGSDYNSTAGQYIVIGRGASANATYGNFTSDRIISAPTDINWIVARVLVLNDSDIATANTLVEAITLGPYNTSVNGSTNTTSKAAEISRAVNGSGYGTASTQIGYLTSLSAQPANWFNASAAFDGIDPPGTGVGQLDTALSSLSVTASNASGLASTAFQLANQVSNRCITGSQVGVVTPTGWAFNNNTGTYGTDYLLRAQTARSGLGALPPSEAIYFLTTEDSQNRTLDASTGNNYTITFPLPLPAQAFWSLTLYNASNYLLVANSIDRYSIGDHTSGLTYSGTNNNTLQVFISAEQPAAGSSQLANWLPAPTNAAFELILRLYKAYSYVSVGDYEPPAVIRTT